MSKRAASKITEGLKEAIADAPVFAFLAESNQIEGIFRAPVSEVDAFQKFLAIQVLSMPAVCELQTVFAPDKPLRDRIGMNVRVGNYTAPMGGRDIQIGLLELLHKLNKTYYGPWALHVEFERLHPFMDGNGRTGRAIWAWHMRRLGLDPFALPFLHRFYYQTLENDTARR